MSDEMMIGTLPLATKEASESYGNNPEERQSVSTRLRGLGKAAIHKCVADPYHALITKPYQKLQSYRPKSFSGAVGKGLLVGIPETAADYGSTIAQTVRDAKNIMRLQSTAQGNDSLLTKGKLALWYSSFGYYQVFDDTLTYPLYLETQEGLGTAGAYGITALATLALAGAVAAGQRGIEAYKARLRSVETTPAVLEDHGRRLIDASVNSAPWQVALIANRSREESEPVPLVSLNKIGQYATAYAAVNTGLYVAAESMPVGEWTGFGLMLAATWTAGGVWSHTKNYVQSRRQLS